MKESKNQSGGKATKFKPGARAGKSNDNTNGVPMLRYGVNTNLHVWKLKMTVMAMQRYGDLARLLEKDEYYEPPMITLRERAQSSQPTIKVEAGDDSNERDVLSLGRTRKGTTAKGSAPFQEQTSSMSSEMAALEQKIRESEYLELNKHRIKLIAKMQEDRASFYAYIIEHFDGSGIKPCLCADTRYMRAFGFKSREDVSFCVILVWEDPETFGFEMCVTLFAGAEVAINDHVSCE